MRAIIVGIISACCILILLYHEARQKPLGPSYSYARQGLNQVAAAQKNPAGLNGAVEILYEALRMDPKDPLALFGLAWALHLRGADEEAYRHYQKTLEQLNELGKFIHYNLSFILEKRGDLPGALQELDEALRFAPDFEAARLRRDSLAAMLTSAEP